MNDVYFACMGCRMMVDAGYRWAYWKLEHHGVVQRQKAVSVEAVLATAAYWAPDDGPDEAPSDWLTNEVLPAVRLFLDVHGSHQLTYGEREEIVGTDPAAVFDWLDVSHLPHLTPRYLVEVLRLDSWAKVLEWARTADHQPWWWEDVEFKELARVKFEEIASAAQPSIAADDRLPRSPRSSPRR